MRVVLPALAILLAAPAVAHAQAFPSKPIRIIAAAGPGGGVDTTSRIVAQNLQDVLGQPGLVENRAGGGGALGGEIVARAPADGHTLLTI
jgi:tripartite-type tricarboxylate transporter receptor subunit TctC